MSPEEKYKRFIETRGKEQPPEFIWEQISEQLDLENVWTQVSHELDTDMVWSRIQQTLDQPVTETPQSTLMRRLMPVTRWAAAAAILLLLAAGAFFVSKYAGSRIPENLVQTGNEPAVTGVKPAGETNLQPEMDLDVQVPRERESVPNSGQPDSGNRDHAPAQETPEFLSIKTVPRLSADAGSGRESFRTPPGNPPSGPADREPLMAMNLPHAGMQMVAPENIPSRASGMLMETSINQTYNMSGGDSRRWYAGLSMHGENNWMLNSETFSGLRENTLVSTQPDFAAHFEIAGGYRIFPGWYLGTSFSFSDRAGQSYLTYVDGYYTTKRVRLTYSGVNVFLKFRKTLFLRGMDYVHFNTYAGGYYHFLRGAEETIGSIQTDISRQYRNMDYGIVFGHELELNAGKGLYLVPGLKIKYGLPNIFNGDANLPAEINKTNTATVELSFGIHFIPGK